MDLLSAGWRSTRTAPAAAGGGTGSNPAVSPKPGFPATGVAAGRGGWRLPFEPQRTQRTQRAIERRFGSGHDIPRVGLRPPGRVPAPPALGHRRGTRGQPSSAGLLGSADPGRVALCVLCVLCGSNPERRCRGRARRDGRKDAGRRGPGRLPTVVRDDQPAMWTICRGDGPARGPAAAGPGVVHSAPCALDGRSYQR